MTPNTQRTREKISKLDYIKLKLLCIKGHNEQSEKATGEIEEIFANHISDNELIYRK